MGDFPATNLGLDVHVGPCTGSQLPTMFGGGYECSDSEARWYHLHIDQYELHSSNNGVRRAALGFLSSVSSTQ